MNVISCSNSKNVLEVARKKIESFERFTVEEAKELYFLPLADLGMLADLRRKLLKAPAYGGKGAEIVTYIIDRNINYTNVCTTYCKFCAFYRTEKDPDHYVLSVEQIEEKIRELDAIGGVQILLQGGHHPKLGIDYYINLLHSIHKKFPHINIHGFSPPEFLHFSKLFDLSIEEVIKRFKEAGLGSIPGGGGEILVDSVRKRIAPLKCSSQEWLEVMRVAHRLGLRSSATMMFGHVEQLEDRLEHLEKIRNLQDSTAGFTAFICWTFQPDNTKLKVAKKGPSEYLRMQALSRIFLDNIENIQSSWVTQGVEVGQIALYFGANDFGSVMMEENVVSAAGTTYRTTVTEIEETISRCGFQPKRRNNGYQLLN
ncbi:cyclic dehypoxanthinyl futalosine synthase [Methylacidiphilum caldifontis]|uniref:Cyclic dehypoxanthine futalosine synthase n=1 Tax=Methylacidiphilum caldifontis TaxID=2795386 RepID=A0A4Y8PB10_9BACT|nr:cyclic dehypoxanthinyl futalosine synthase [Methylacidiphilum caldifontis]TFE67702.1 dehypoxanthine futalosine cyclase [Methylacidiphilum caldifontis]